MALKRARQSTRRVKTLKVKNLSADKAKQVKGGPCPGTNTNLTRLN
jgi:hypothetical protein